MTDPYTDGALVIAVLTITMGVALPFLVEYAHRRRNRASERLDEHYQGVLRALLEEAQRQAERL